MRKSVTRFAVLGVILLLSSGMAHAQESQGDPKLPKDHWAYGVLDRATPGEVPVQIDYDHTRADWGMTRLQFAVGTARLLDRLSPSGPLHGAPPDSPARLHALRRLVWEFEPELRQIGCTMPAVYARLAIQTPFPNVPPAHWAYASVERLRKAGIVIGSPNGDF